MGCLPHRNGAESGGRYSIRTSVGQKKSGCHGVMATGFWGRALNQGARSWGDKDAAPCSERGVPLQYQQQIGSNNTSILKNARFC